MLVEKEETDLPELKGIAVSQERPEGVGRAEENVSIKDAINEHRLSDINEGEQGFFATMNAVERILGVHVSEGLAESHVELLQMSHVRADGVLHEVFEGVVGILSAGD